MGGIFSKPKIPAPPPLVMPEPTETPDYEDEARKAQAEEDERRRVRGRKGRQSTILNTAQGLGEITDEE